MRSGQGVKRLVPVPLLIGFRQAENIRKEPPRFVREAVNTVPALLKSDGEAAIGPFISEAMILAGGSKPQYRASG
jgi:hypothetical protein